MIIKCEQCGSDLVNIFNRSCIVLGFYKTITKIHCSNCGFEKEEVKDYNISDTHM